MIPTYAYLLHVPVKGDDIYYITRHILRFYFLATCKIITYRWYTHFTTTVEAGNNNDSRGKRLYFFSIVSIYL